MSPVDQHETEDQTHGRVGGVRDAQTGVGERPMIHYRRTHPISPGRHTDAIALAKEWAALWKDAGVDLQCSEVITGTLGRACVSADFETMAAFEAARTRMEASPKTQAFNEKFNKEARDGTAAFIPNTEHEEFWRDA